MRSSARGVAFHYVVAAGAVNVHVDEARHHRHARRHVVDRARGNAYLVAVAERRDPAAFDDDYAVADLFLRGQDAAGVDGDGRHV